MDATPARSRLRQLFMLLAVLMLVTALVAACGEDDAGDDEGDDAAEGTDDSEGEEDDDEGDDGEAASTLDQIRERGFVRVAFANEPPYSEVGEDGVSISGAAVEVPRAVMAKLGVDEVDGVVIPYDSMIPGLQARRFDMVTAGLFMTPERCSEVIYSEPDVCGTESFAVVEGNPLGLDSYASLAENDAVVGVPGGSVEEEYALDAGVPEGNIEIIPDSRSGIESLQAGRIDAYALPTLSIRDLLDGAEGLEEVGPLDDVPIACAGAAFHPDDGEFRDAYNEALDELKDEGEFADILESFGFPGDVPQEITSEELCAG